MKTIKWLETKKKSIAQIYDSGMEYSFVSDGLKQSHEFVYCKDFLQDAVHGSLNERDASVYGFVYDHKNKLCNKKTRILLTNRSDKKFGESMKKIIDFVNQFAKKLHLKPTKAYPVSNPPKKYEKCGVFLTEGSVKWMNSPPLLSMYTLLLRCGGSHTIGNDCMATVEGINNWTVNSYGQEDGLQITEALPGIKDILKLGYRPFFYIDDKKNYPEEVDTDTMHESGGIVSFSSAYQYDPICPYWHRPSLGKRLKR